MAFFSAGPGWSPSERGALWGQDAKTAGLDYLVTLFMRSDTPTGIGTPAWGAPQQMWDGLIDAIRTGKVVVSDPQAWEMLREKGGWTPQTIGGAALTPANAQPGGLAGTTGGGGGGGADQALQDYLASIQANAQAMQAAELAYQDWVMRTGDDKLAFEKANEAWRQTFEQASFDYQKQKDQWALQQSAGFYEVNGQRVPTLAGIAQEAGLTGQYQGRPTFAREQYETSTMQGLLGLQAGLRGPANYGQYLKVLGSTPQGMRDVVNSAAGRFALPSTTGQAGATQSADVQSLLNDVRTGAPGAQQEWQQALSGGLPAPNQLNLANWSRMLPSQKGMLQSAYESQGWDVNDFNAMVQQSAPTGTGARAGSFRF